jgi:hypothetical protein
MNVLFFVFLSNISTAQVQSVSCKWDNFLCTEYIQDVVYTPRQIEIFKRDCERNSGAVFSPLQCQNRELGCWLSSHGDSSIDVINWFTTNNPDGIKANCEEFGGVIVQGNLN